MEPYIARRPAANRRAVRTVIALPVTCPVFIGRDAELAALNDARRDLARSRGSFVAIGGEAGIGKSRLVRHFLERTGDRRVRNLARAECLEGSTEPFGPVRTIVEMLMAAEPLGDVPHRALLALGRIAPALATEHAREAAAAPVDRAEFSAGLFDLLTAVARKRSTILVFEDVQWADPSTLEFLAYLAARVDRTRLLVVVTHRSEELGRNTALLSAFARMERMPSLRRLELAPFGPEDVRTLVASAMDGRAPIPEETLEAIVALSDGNAFFAEELLKDAFTIGRDAERRLPLSIRGIISERCATFDPFARRVLSFAAVLGRRFDPPLLATIMHCSIDDLVSALTVARDAALLVEDADQPGFLRFRHALTRQVIYAQLLAFDTRRLHRRIVETLEAAGGTQFYALAEHAAAAGDVTRTIAYGERAGEASWALGGYAEAIESFERALAVAEREDDRARLIERLAFPVIYSGNLRRGIALWERALDMRMRRSEYADAARLSIVILCERFNAGELADERESLLAFVAEHGARLQPLQRERIAVLVACLRSELGHVTTIDALLARIDDPAQLPLDVVQGVYLARINRAAYFGTIGAWRDEVASLDALPPVHDNPSVAALNVTDHLASVISNGLSLGTNAELEAALVRGRAVARDWGFERFVTYYEALEASYLVTRGRLAEARERFNVACGDSMHLTSSLLARTAPFLAIALDDDSLVQRTISPDVLARERAALRANAESHTSRLLLGGFALWLDRRGRSAEADDLVTETFARIPYPSPRFAPLVTTALRQLGTDRMPDLAVFAQTRHLAADDGVGHATAMLAAGSLTGDPAVVRAAAAAYERAGLSLCAAHAYHLAGAGAEAQALYRSCGATGYLDRPARNAEKQRLPSRLSEREYAVAELVGLGLTNLAIAERLSVSKKTIEKYLTSIFRKLGLRSRSQVAARLNEIRGSR